MDTNYKIGDCVIIKTNTEAINPIIFNIAVFKNIIYYLIDFNDEERLWLTAEEIEKK